MTEKKRTGLGEFPIPPSKKEKKSKPVEEAPEEKGPPDAGLFSIKTPVEVSKQLDSVDTPKITEEDREKFLESILFEQPFTETLDLFGGKLKVTLRTRIVAETEQILSYVRDQSPEAMIDVEMALGKANLAYALVSLETDKGVEMLDSPRGVTTSLGVRLERVHQFPAPKFTALVTAMSKFDRKVFALSEEAIRPDFSQAEDAG